MSTDLPPDSVDVTDREPPIEAIDVVVVGATLTGLTAARDLARRGYRVTVIDQADAAGGSACSHELGDATVSAGPHGAVDADGVIAELAAELGLALQSRSGARDAFAQRDRIVPIPANTVLGVPGTPLAEDVIAVLGWSGALRAYLDRLRPVLKIGKYGSLGRLVRSRMGRAVAERMLAPVTRARFGSEAEQLQVADTVPQLNNAITKAGSLSGGVAAVVAEHAADASLSEKDVVGGMEALAAALLADALEYHARLRLQTAVEAAVRDDEGLLLTMTGGEHLRTQALIYADSGMQAADAVALRVPTGALAGAERFGTVFAAGADAAPQVTHVTDLGAIFPHRQPGEDTILLVGCSDLEDMPDDACVSLAEEAAERIMRRPLPTTAAAVLRISQPQPVPPAGGGIRVIPTARDLATELAAARRTASAVQRADFAVPGRAWSDDINDDAHEQGEEPA